MDIHGHIDNLIDRARTLLGFMSEDEVVFHLAENGAIPEDAWLAVKAAQILDRGE